MDSIKEMWPLLKEYREFVVIILAVLVGRVIIVKFYKRRKGLKKRDNFIIGINNVSFLIGGVWAFLFVLHLVGITVREFFTSIAIIAAALAIVFRDYILNGLNGMILMFGENVHIGDYIEVGRNKGVIRNITLLYVHLENDKEDLVIIPNNIFVSETYVNHSRNRKRKSGLEFGIESSNAVSIATLTDKLMEVAKEAEKYLVLDSVKLKILEIEEDIIKYRWQFSMKKYSHSEEMMLKQMFWAVIIEHLSVQKGVLTDKK